MIDYTSSATELLGAQGPFAQALPGFMPRPQQQAMSEAVRRCLQDRGQLVIEAGTGVGKTFAYLLPAVLDGGKVIISTGTRHLQDQLFHRDLPVVLQNLKLNLKTALLKGRANYLCRQRLQLAGEQAYGKIDFDHLQALQSWARLTRSGDIAEICDIPEDAAIWPKVTSTVDNCLGSECPKFNDCYLVKARRLAQEADIVVVNHHLFFADMALKEDGFGELLPSANTFILDEAHQLPEVATRFFGQALSSRQLHDLMQDSLAAQLHEAGDMGGMRDCVQALDTAIKRFRLSLGTAERREGWQVQPSAAREALHQLQAALQVVHDLLSVAAERGEALANCARRSALALQRLEQFQAGARHEIQWLETLRNGFSLHCTPLEIGTIFNNYMHAYTAAWVFTSATLAVNGRFEHFTGRLGLQVAETQLLDSPYDYPNNTLLYLPPGMPEPNTPDYSAAVLQASLHVLQASGGRAFMLFTSHRALQQVAQALTPQLDYPLLVQGEAPRSQLLDRFREAGNAVLLGTSSFWEGVDIKGEALSCVIIDKLPFAAPDDPVMQARLAMLREAGGNPFMDYQIPQAVIALKQGVGRLIRDAHDRGVLMICDPRLKSKPYGRLFLNSLPDIPLTQSLRDVQRFFARDAASA